MICVGVVGRSVVWLSLCFFEIILCVSTFSVGVAAEPVDMVGPSHCFWGGDMEYFAEVMG